MDLGVSMDVLCQPSISPVGPYGRACLGTYDLYTCSTIEYTSYACAIVGSYVLLDWSMELPTVTSSPRVCNFMTRRDAIRFPRHQKVLNKNLISH